MLSPGGYIAISTVSSINQEVNFTISTGGVCKGTGKGGTVHSQVSGSTIGNGSGDWICFHNNRFCGFSVSIGGHDINGMICSRICGSATSRSGNRTCISIDVESCWQSGCRPSWTICTNGNRINRLSNRRNARIEWNHITDIDNNRTRLSVY